MMAYMAGLEHAEASKNQEPCSLWQARQPVEAAIELAASGRREPPRTIFVATTVGIMDVAADSRSPLASPPQRLLIRRHLAKICCDLPRAQQKRRSLARRNKRPPRF